MTKKEKIKIARSLDFGLEALLETLKKTDLLKESQNRVALESFVMGFTAGAMYQDKLDERIAKREFIHSLLPKNHKYNNK